MPYIVTNVIALLFALAGMVYLLLLEFRRTTSQDRSVVYAMTLVLLCSLVIPNVLLQRFDEVVITTINVLGVFLVWLVVLLIIRYNRTIKENMKHKIYFDALIHGGTHAIVILDKRQEIVIANEKVLQLFDYKIDEVLNKHIETILEVEDGKSYFLNYDNEAPVSLTRKVVRRKDGCKVPVEISKRTFLWDSEAYEILYIQDISDLEKISRDLAWQHNFSQALHDTAQVFFLTLTESGNIISINNFGRRLLGTEDVIGKYWFYFIPDEAKPEALNFFLNPEALSISYTGSIHSQHNHEYLIEWTGTRIKPTYGNENIYMYAGTDITKAVNEQKLIKATGKVNVLNEVLKKQVAQRTQELKEVNNNLHIQIKERRHIENELLNTQRLYNALAHNFPNGLIGVLNKDLRYVLVDGKELSRLKIKSEALIGHKFFELYPDFTKVYEGKLNMAFAGETVSFDVELSGSAYNIIAVGLPDMQNDQINEILVVISNITQWKKLEEDLHRAISQEKELIELKSRFVTMASHEFRTPLGTILSSIFLLERYNDSGYEEKRTIHINRIKKTVNNLTEVLNNFLSLGKLEEGKIHVIQTQTKIQESINEIIREMSPIKKPDQRIEYVARGLNRAVMLDPHLMHNILMNLISNAIKYSPANGVVKIISDLTNEYLVVCVIDQGMGIPEDEQPYIFERFFRSRNAVNIEGTGLGLHIVKKYVELMDGTIEFSSNENGTTFKVRIPIG